MKTVKLILFVAVLYAIFFYGLHTFAAVRSVYPKTDQILPIRTAIGIATIIQTPESIQSAIIGDAGAFKVQYLNDAVTIKPLRYGARTNLYLVTQSQRYNLRLYSVNQSQADYVVYIKNITARSRIYWRAYNRMVRRDSGIIHVLRVGRTSAGFILIDGRLALENRDRNFGDGSGNTNNMQNANEGLKPPDFWVFQGTAPKPINTLYLSNLHGSAPITFSVALRMADLQRFKPLTLELKRYNNLRVVIPESVLWR